MQSQREKDWNQRYLDSDTPWEDLEPYLDLDKILSKYGKRNSSVLEIGCGLGKNAYYLASLGYRVTAIDISEQAVELASNRFRHSNLKFHCFDFIQSDLGRKFDVAFDKGCLHSFTHQESYNHFAKSVAENLVEEGIWINISGNADHPDDLAKRMADSYPRLSLSNLAMAVEPFFEVQEIRNTHYGKEVSFLAWLGVFKKRQYFYTEKQMVCPL
jgi:methyl halide transferase